MRLNFRKTGGNFAGDATQLRRAGRALALAAALLLFARLGAVDLWAPDEPRYAQVAEELRAGGHGASGWLLLHLNGEPYTQKPPLYFWLAALAGAGAGRVTEWAARLPSALSGWLAVALTLRLGAQLLGARTALWGAALLLTVGEFAWRARRAQIDVLLALLEMLALWAFWQLDRGRPGRGRQLALFHAALGLALLAKGPVGLIAPLLGIAAYLAWEGRLRELRRLLSPRMLLLSLAPGILWLAAVLAAAPRGSFEDAVVTNLVGRFFSGTAHPRPFYYYLYQFPVDFLPWTLLWPAVAWAGRGALAANADPARRRAWRFLLSWLFAALAFFSLSAGKRGLYLLPVFPAAALLCADAARRWRARRGVPRGLATGLGALAVALALAALGAGVWGEAFFGVAIPGAFGAAVAAVAAAAIAAWRRLPDAAARAAVAIAAVLAIELAIFASLLPALDPEKSPRPVAEAAAALTRPGERVGLVGRRSLVGGLVYYGERPVAVLDEPGALARFLEAGGRVVVATRRRLEEVRAAGPLEVRARLRSGARALYVLSTPDAGEAEPRR